MRKNNHPIEQEELMAYLDGELAVDRAVQAAAHLERCQQCQELAADLRKLSQEMMAWEIEQPETLAMSAEIAAALEKPMKKPGKRATSAGWRWGMLFTPSRMAWAGGGAFLLLLVMATFLSNLQRNSKSAREAARMARERAHQELRGSSGDDTYSARSAGITGYAPTNGLAQDNGQLTASELKPGASSEDAFLIPPPPPPPPASRPDKAKVAASDDTGAQDDATPMIARAAALLLISKEFEKTHASLEEILKRYNGYIGELNVSAPDEAGRTLTGTLRIPSARFDSAMAELKKLGRVENEAQGGEEVTQQYVDLEARIANAQHTEQRLTEILRRRTGKLQDVLKVELEIDRVRGEIEQMQAEKKELSKRVAFATVNMTVKEEYHARLQATPPSTGSRFRNAAVDGYNSVVEGLISVGLFLLSSGPGLLLWAAILFFPARWAWRKWREKTDHGETATQRKTAD
jgi:anti-sigma factor RsiW